MTDPRSNVFDMWPARGGGIVVPTRASDVAGQWPAYGGTPVFPRTEPNLYDTPAERARIERAAEVARRELLQDRVKWGSLVVALVTVIYFAGEFVRVAF